MGKILSHVSLLTQYHLSLRWYPKGLEICYYFFMIISSKAQQLSPYIPGEQPKQPGLYTKLNTNENPYPPSPTVEDVIRHCNWEELRLYPDPDSSALKEAIAESYAITREQVFVGNGSDEVLSLGWYAFFDPCRGSVLFPEHTYSFYPVYSQYYGQPFKRIPLKRDFSIDIPAFEEEMNSDCAGVIFPNPNAPTGIALSVAEIERLLKKSRGEFLVVVDEAYVDYGSDSALPLIADYPNLLVVHTCSKSRALAGLRVGYAMGDKALISVLTAVKDSFNSYPLDRFSQKIAEIAIRDSNYYEGINRRIVETREWFSRALEKQDWKVLPSKANFIFASHPDLDGKELYEQLKSCGFLVRFFNHQGIESFVRITIGTDRDMEKLLQSIGDLDKCH